MPNSDGVSLPARILFSAIANMSLVWLLASKLPAYFVLTGGLGAYIVVGALITLLNIFLRPVLTIITLPLKLFATVLAIIIVNGVFVELIIRITANMKEELVTLQIAGGLWGWLVVAFAFGVANWLLKAVLK